MRRLALLILLSACRRGGPTDLSSYGLAIVVDVPPGAEVRAGDRGPYVNFIVDGKPRWGVELYSDQSPLTRPEWTQIDHLITADTVVISREERPDGWLLVYEGPDFGGGRRFAMERHDRKLGVMCGTSFMPMTQAELDGPLKLCASLRPR